MIRFQTNKGKITSVNLMRTIPFSDVLNKLEVCICANANANANVFIIALQ